MFTRHYAHWPPGLPHTLEVPRASVYANLEASARRHPGKTAIDFYGTKITYAELKRGADGYEVNGRPLRFYHYSGFDPLKRYALSKHQVGKMRRGPGGGFFVTALDSGPATRAIVIYLVSRRDIDSGPLEVLVDDPAQYWGRVRHGHECLAH